MRAFMIAWSAKELPQRERELDRIAARRAFARACSNNSRASSLPRALLGRFRVPIFEASSSKWGIACRTTRKRALRKWLSVSRARVAFRRVETAPSRALSAPSVRTNWRFLSGRSAFVLGSTGRSLRFVDDESSRSCDISTLPRVTRLTYRIHAFWDAGLRKTSQCPERGSAGLAVWIQVVVLGIA